MNYELAKQLKEAGFPQWGGKNNSVMLGGEPTRWPDLSELIEACDKSKFFILMRDEVNWKAGNGDTPLEGLTSFGSTPEEAVAKLWLELNKK